MLSADFAVQIKLIIMYALGIIALIATFFYLHHVTHQWLSKFSIRLSIIIVIMLIILTVVIKLP